MRGMKWTESEIRRLKELHESGLKTQEISEAMNRSIGSIHRRISMEIYSGNLVKKHKPVRHDIDFDLVKEMYLRGIRVVDIAVHFGINASAMNNIVLDMMELNELPHRSTFIRKGWYSKHFSVRGS